MLSFDDIEILSDRDKGGPTLLRFFRDSLEILLLNFVIYFFLFYDSTFTCFCLSFEKYVRPMRSVIMIVTVPDEGQPASWEMRGVPIQPHSSAYCHCVVCVKVLPRGSYVFLDVSDVFRDVSTCFTMCFVFLFRCFSMFLMCF